MTQVLPAMTQGVAQQVLDEIDDVSYMSEALDELRDFSHAISIKCGWWHHTLNRDEAKPRNAGEMVALMHSELSEMLEGVRKNVEHDEHVPAFTSEEVELADLLHRVFDYAGARRLRLGDAYLAKGQYNMEREDHKPANRSKPGGKAF